MIVRYSGELTELNDESVVIQREGIAREVLVTAYGVTELAPRRGQQVTLHTMELIEGNPQSGNLTPIMIGFASREEKLFFRKFISVKGIGVRKALRALSVPVRRMAGWIQEGDTKALATLKGIGARAAQQIVVDLKGKVADLAIPSDGEDEQKVSTLTDAQHDALIVLTEWGDSRADAERYLTLAAKANPKIDTADEWVRAAYRIRGGAA